MNDSLAHVRAEFDRTLSLWQDEYLAAMRERFGLDLPRMEPTVHGEHHRDAGKVVKGGHDVSNQPRDEHGRFGEGSGGKLSATDGTPKGGAEGIKNYEQLSLSRYAGSVNAAIVNGYLRGEKMSFDKWVKYEKLNATDQKFTNMITRGLDSMLARSTLETDRLVMRAVSAEYGEKLAGQVGKTLTFKGYTSTTTSAERVASFKGIQGERAVLSIHVPKGSNALDIENLRQSMGANHGLFEYLPKEHEVLLPRGSKFQVMSSSVKDGVTHVHLSMVPSKK